MANDVRIPVPAGLVSHGGPFFEVVLKEPSYDDYMQLGEIVSFGKAPDGTIFSVENGEVLREYIGRCLVSPKDPLALGQGGLKLAKAVRGAVLGFFLDERSRAEPSLTSPTSSFSDAAKDASTPTPSAG